MRKEFTIFCDESDKKGTYFSNFYGGLIVNTSELQNIEATLSHTKDSLNLFKEVKWSKVTDLYLDKYMSLIDAFFEFIKSEKVKIRIMFTQNYYQATNLSKYQKDNGYFILYYQFLKHAFGLQYSNEHSEDNTYIRIYLDTLPDTKEKTTQFKGYLLSLNNFPEFKKNNITLMKDQIAEVDSKKHVLLQCLDIILGSMQFRLNDKHKEKNPETGKRGKKTIAKEKLYKHIYAHVNSLLPQKFNPGQTTGRGKDRKDIWNHTYRHWLFKPNDYEIDPSKKK